MKWSEISKPIKGVSWYDHTILKSPIGEFKIEWKSHKESPSYCVMLDDEWIDSKYSIEDAKKVVELFLKNKSNELLDFLNVDHIVSY